MSIREKYLRINTSGSTEIIDLTPDCRDFLSQEGCQSGLLTVHVPGSTAAITTIEYEPGLIQSDIDKMLEGLAPKSGHYKHNDTWGDGNGYSHCRAALLGPSLTIPVSEGEAVLGTWQQIVFVECDNRPRQRRVFIQFMGEIK